ncbi:ubiquitin fusion degradation protein [Phlyctochytrium planicorne]|nr:ubiquitin fusion degradation protein [Phlyctochytrium planicorne]
MFQGGYEYEDNGNWNFVRGGAASRGFNEYFRAFSMAMMHGNDREDVNFGGKVLLPPSALERLATLNIAYPMLFEITNEAQKKLSHAGVLEFTAEEGKVYLPQWMMSTLLLEEGSLVRVKSTNLPLGKFVKLQPQSVDFLDISDPKAVLEKSISNFSALTEGDIIAIKYNRKQYDILIMEAKPGGKGVSVIETDLEVDFAPPVGYVEPERLPPKSRQVALGGSTSTIEAHTREEPNAFSAFNGSGQKLNGKAPASQQGTNDTQSAKSKVPAALNLPPGKLFFGYPVIPLNEPEKQGEAQTFSGSGQTLRAARKAGSSSGSSSSLGPSQGSSSGSSKRP